LALRIQYYLVGTQLRLRVYAGTFAALPDCNR